MTLFNATFSNNQIFSKTKSIPGNSILNKQSRSPSTSEPIKLIRGHRKIPSNFKSLPDPLLTSQFCVYYLIYSLDSNTELP